MLFLAGAILLVQISIAASQILLACSAAACVWGRLRQKQNPYVLPPFAWPLFALFLWTAFTALMSPHFRLSLIALKKFFLFSIPLMIPVVAKPEGVRTRIYQALIGAGTFAAAAGLVQYATSTNRDLEHRITGFMSHWMTFAGLSMLVAVAAAAYLLSFGIRRGWWAVPAGCCALGAILVSQTRSAMIGAVAALLALIVLRRKYGAILVVAAAIFCGYILSPVRFQERFRAGLDPDHPHTRPRLVLIRTGIRLIRANPILGVGPGGVAIEAPKYVEPSARPEWTYIHLHNNFIQIAAERGIPGLMLWLWFMIRVSVDPARCLRRSTGSDPESLLVTAAAFGASVALLTAGMFEYNFGDSEVLMTFLFMIGAPYADEELRKTQVEKSMVGEG